MNPRYRLPVVAGVAVVVIALVLGAIIGLGSLGSSAQGAAATPSRTPVPTATPDPRMTPEGTTRAFFAAFAAAWKTDDPSLVGPFVTSKESSAYLTVAGYLGGAQGVGRASIITTNSLDNMTSQVSGDTATVDFYYTEGGYDINPSTGAALESPTVLPPIHLTASLKRVNGLWLMDSYVGHS